MGNQMGNMFQQNQFNPNQGTMNQPGNTNQPNMPPPLPPTEQFFVAVNGQQTGPFTVPVLMQMAQSGTFTRESMVWKAGMSAWFAAGQVPEITSVFNSVPPPPPPAM
jgi:GYF domain 2